MARGWCANASSRTADRAERTIGTFGQLDELRVERAWWALVERRGMSLEDTLRRLPPGAVDFARELFDHHWSEAAWLYARREVLEVQGALLSSDEWLDIETRAEAHVVALCLGGRLVLDECGARVRDGDAGELHTAMRVLCRGDHVAAFDAAIDGLDWPIPARANAVADALIWDAPERWQELVGAILADEATPKDALGPLATVAGVRGWPVGDLLVGVLEDRVGNLAATIDAVARLRVAEAWPVLSELISDAEQPAAVRSAAAVAAACFDARAVGAYVGQLLVHESWAAVPLATTAGPEALPLLDAALAREGDRSEILLGIGLLGHGDGVPRLLDALGDEATAEAAAEALYLITGAELHEETSLVEEREVDPEDAEGVEPEPIGLPVTRLTCSRRRWVEWLEGHGFAAHGPERRFRLGVPFDPSRVVDELGRTSLRPELREAMAAELAIRYRVPRWYSSRWLVSKQRQSLTRTKMALAEHGRIEPGAWVADGRVLSGHGIRTRRP